jgi:choline transport protein
MLLALIPLGSSTAFNNIISLSVAGLYASYLLTTSLLLWRRLRGDMMPFPTPESIVSEHEGLSWGPWRIPAPLGTINNAFACIYLLFIWFWSFWPPQAPATPETMNYSILVFGATVLFSILYYVARGHKEFTGPIREVDETL